MPVYQRMSMVVAVQFSEEKYHSSEGLKSYPAVFDKAMGSELWFGKKAEDGRYYISQQPLAGGLGEYQTVNNGDYIIFETNYHYILPKAVFESHYEWIGELNDQENE